jgi:hypothetical protein
MLKKGGATAAPPSVPYIVKSDFAPFMFDCRLFHSLIISHAKFSPQLDELHFEGYKDRHHGG